MSSNESLEKSNFEEVDETIPLLVDRASPVYIVIEDQGEV